MRDEFVRCPATSGSGTQCEYERNHQPRRHSFIKHQRKPRTNRHLGDETFGRTSGQQFPWEREKWKYQA